MKRSSIINDDDEYGRFRDNINDDKDDTSNTAMDAVGAATKRRPPNPLESASLLSRFTFAWNFQLLRKGMDNVMGLEEIDLPQLVKSDQSCWLLTQFENNIWDIKTMCSINRGNKSKRATKKDNTKEKNKHGQYQLARALLMDYWKSTFWARVLLNMNSIVKVFQAYSMGKLLEAFGSIDNDNGNDYNNHSQAYLWGCMMILCGSIAIPTKQHQFNITFRKGIQLRIALIAAIYAKTTKLSSVAVVDNSYNSISTVDSIKEDNGTRKKANNNNYHATSGHVTNLASNDVEKFLMTSIFTNLVIGAPLEAALILFVGCTTLGQAFAAGFGIFVVAFLPLQSFLGKKFALYRSRVAALTDNRVSFVSQALSGSRIMKMNGWELEFEKRIAQKRRLEIKQLQNSNMLRGLNEAIYYFGSISVVLFVLILHVFVLEGDLTVRNVFTTMTLMNMLQYTLTLHLPNAVMGLAECSVSAKRIQRFLELPEREVVYCAPASAANLETTGTKPCRRQEELLDNTTLLSMNDVTCYWNGGNNENYTQSNSSIPNTKAVANVTIDFHAAEMVCIIGSVGCGKSALLQAIVNELPISTGNVTRNYESLAYAPQDPWIMNGTIQENILMGLEFKKQWYDEVIESCGLLIDLGLFRNGDMTLVGDRGVQCSGGQRARIGLARALYRNADILVLDDPLSAVDARVGRQIFDMALLNLSIKRGKCVILATHQHQYVREQRCILVVEGGKVQGMGSYDDIVVPTAVDKILSSVIDNAVVDFVDKCEENESNDKNSVLKKGNNENNFVSSLTNKSETDKKNESSESKQTGVVRLETFKQYAKAMGGTWLAIFMLLLFSVTQATYIITIRILGQWPERDDPKSIGYVQLVITLCITIMFLSLFRASLFFYLTLEASRELHDKMTHAVLRTSVSFFDTNPLGRILNRFSADVGSNDELLPMTIFSFAVGIFIFMGSVIASTVVLPFLLLVLPFLIYGFLRLRRIFLQTTRELKRFESLARSPIFAMLSETLRGVATIRANDSVPYLIQKMEVALDAHSRATQTFSSASRWFATTLDCLSFILMSSATLLSILFATQGWFSIEPAVLGLALSLLVQMSTQNFPYIVRLSAEVVNNMIAVERVLEFANLQPEAELELASDKDILENGWMSGGAVEVNDLSVRYRAGLPRALDGATFAIPPGSRVGIVGRTGSGKSTIVQTLFRLLEAEHGTIFIDGVDIAKVGLHNVRKNISVIPQSPTLFSGCTIRENLDLFNVHSDTDIHNAIANASLTSLVKNLPQGIHSQVLEDGANFSVGQRQLLCLARASLNKKVCKLLILDEATASVDRDTDQLLHASLESSFQDCTILAVAHRLDTVINSDYILVLDKGRVVEFGPPVDLLLKVDGRFRTMVEDTGETTSKALKDQAFRSKKAN